MSVKVPLIFSLYINYFSLDISALAILIPKETFYFINTLTDTPSSLPHPSCKTKAI